MVCETQFTHTVKLILAWTQLKLVFIAYWMHVDSVTNDCHSFYIAHDRTNVWGGKKETLAVCALKE